MFSNLSGRLLAWLVSFLKLAAILLVLLGFGVLVLWFLDERGLLPPALSGWNFDGMEPLAAILAALASGLFSAAGWFLARREQEKRQTAVNASAGGDYSPAIVQQGDNPRLFSSQTGQVSGDLYQGEQQIFFLTREPSEQLLRTIRRPDDATLQTLTQNYLNALLTRYRYLDFKGMGISDRVPLKLPLIELFVPLRARIELPEGEAWSPEARLAGWRVRDLEEADTAERVSQPLNIFDLLQKHNGLIILGDPGSGKTTLLKYLALTLALGKGDELNIPSRLPVLVPLAAYANRLAEGDVPLDRFVCTFHAGVWGTDNLTPLLQEALPRGVVLFLLDGLDEVRDPALRSVVADRVAAFYSSHAQHGNRFVLTSRIVGYRQTRPQADGLQECTLIDFDDDEIALFCAKWVGAVEKQTQDSATLAQQEAEGQQERLLEAIHSRESVRRLAANPLLLTILALMQRQNIVLPDQRVDLYARYVETLLHQWNLARSLHRPGPAVADVKETTRLLAALALWIQERNPGAGLVREDDLEAWLEALLTAQGHPDPAGAARQFLADVREHANLLVERGNRQYGFLHLTFQEYFAAVGVGQLGATATGPVVEKLAAVLDHERWREVTLLTLGYVGIRQERPEAVAEIVQGLLAWPGLPAGRAALFAGEALHDMGHRGITHACREMVLTQLQETVGAPQAQAAIRVAAGRVLGRLGDRRAEIMQVDAMPFCYVPPGPFRMGSDEGLTDDRPFWQERYDAEAPCHLLDLPYGYWIARYPVSCAQYALFVAEGGYADPAWWTEAREHGFWEEGRLRARTWLPDKEEVEWMTREGPFEYGEPFTLPNHPQTGLCWYEALAFTRWLHARWQPQLPAGWRVQLPSEPEWEKAARGGIALPPGASAERLSAPDRLAALPTLPPAEAWPPNPLPRRRYPWGETISDQEANYRGKFQGSSTPGAFPGNLSPYGGVDMGGNLFEWCRSLYGRWEKGGFVERYGYPWELSAGRERLDAGFDWTRALRGGSWASRDTIARCACRFYHNPNHRGSSFGVRVVVSPFPLASDPSDL